MFSRNTSTSFYFLLVINSGIISFVTITSSDSLFVIILSDSIIILIAFKNVRNARTFFRYCKIVWLLFWKYSLENSVDMLILFWLSVNHSLTLTKSKIITYTAVDWSLKTVGVTVWTYFNFFSPEILNCHDESFSRTLHRKKLCDGILLLKPSLTLTRIPTQLLSKEFL